MKCLELNPHLQISRRPPKLAMNDLHRLGAEETNWDIEWGRLVDQARNKEVTRIGPTLLLHSPAMITVSPPDSGTVYPYSADEVREIFEPLATRWEAETEFLSMTPQITGHPAFFEMVGLGYPAVPLVLKRLQKSTRPWFQALEAMTRENPAADAETNSEAAQSWLDWGRSRGLID